MAKLGTQKHPAVVRVHTEEHAMEMLQIADEHGWYVIAGVEPDKPEDTSDIKRLLKANAPPYKELESDDPIALPSPHKAHQKAKVKKKQAKKARKKNRRR